MFVMWYLEILKLHSYVNFNVLEYVGFLNFYIM